MSFRFYIYKHVPKKWRHTLGASKLVAPLRELFFRKLGKYREETVRVQRMYSDYHVKFNFVASLQIATKAAERGMENTLINNAITLLKKYKPSETDDYTIFDVGANFGYLSLVWKQSIAQNGKVYAFEPHPTIYNSLKKSVSSNQIVNLEVLNKAVSHASGSIELHLSSTTSNTLQQVARQNKANKTVAIDMITLDQFVNQNKITSVDLIKIDVDGIELDILKGAKQTIIAHKPIVIVETNGDAVIHLFLREQGYKIFDMQLEECLDDSVLPVNSFGVPV